ncbi:hypothetical protein [Caldalkalibacillus mannanilyticus]|uniref:hypothetical protein n=1 Tax=Caldalkalibacillus mannanilyticus TaxID=1418 RepID=UPI0011DD5E74|nr:hypothetical protein [Caldalkalibacillus mannanilyticus]
MNEVKSLAENIDEESSNEVNTIESNIDNTESIEGIEPVYDLSFEKISTPEILFEEFEIFDPKNIEELILEEELDPYTFLIYKKKQQPDDSQHYEYLGFRINSQKSTLYEIGEIGYGPENYSIEKVNVLNKDLIKLSGPCGAACHQSYYMDASNELKPSIFLHLSYKALVETDLTGDGSKELISHGGLPSSSAIYIEEDGEIKHSLINDTLRKAGIGYIEENNVFYAWFIEKNITAIYRYQDKKMHFVRFEE